MQAFDHLTDSKSRKFKRYTAGTVGERLESRVLFAAGTLDATFGVQGVAIGGLFASAASVMGAFQNDSKVVLVANSDTGRYAGNGDAPFIVARLDDNGSLDPTFASGAGVTTPVEANAFALAIQPDGKIVVVGSTGEFFIARYLANGLPDQTFGEAGTVEIPFGGSDNVSRAFAVSIEGDGRILVAGNEGNAQGQQAAIARLMPNGALDPSFGAQGKVEIGFNQINSIIPQPDGKILVDFGGILARLDANGTQDTAFGTGGYVDIEPDADEPVALQPNGDIVVGGFSADVFRFTASGMPDTSFGTAGVVSSPLQGPIISVFLQTSGDIVAVGEDGLIRYTPRGVVDQTFGSGGIASLPYNLLPEAAGVRPDGKVVVVGQGAVIGIPLQGYGALQDGALYVARFTAAGQLDRSFGYYGTLLNPNGISGNIDAMALQSDGKVVVAGTEISTAPGIPDDAVLARYNADGSLDTSFGAGGRAIFGVAGHGLYSALAVEPNGDIVAGGYCRFGGRGVMLIVRFLPNGQRDPSFGVNGAAMTNLGPAFLECSGIAVQPNGDIVADGTSYDAKGRPQIDVVRYLPNGALDRKFGVGGIELIDPGGAGAIASAFGLTVEPNGKIVIAGMVGVSAAAIRMTPSGSLDTTFGSGGVATTLYVSNGASYPAEATNVVVNAAGDIFIDERPTGGFGSGVVRFLPNGKIDPSFGKGGTLDTFSDLDGSSSIALAPNGQIVVGGVDSATESTTEIARYNTNGLDSTFGVEQLSLQGGNVEIASPSSPTNNIFPIYYPPASVLLIGADGKVYAAAGSDVFRVLSK